MDILGKLSRKVSGLYGIGGGLEEPEFEEKDEGDVIISVDCEIHKYDPEKGLYVAISRNVKASLIKKNDEKYSYVLSVRDNVKKSVICSTKVCTQMMPTFFHNKRAFTWVELDNSELFGSPSKLWSLRFAEGKGLELNKFEKAFLDVLYLATIMKEKSDLSMEDNQYVNSAYRTEAMEISDDEGSDNSSETDYGEPRSKIRSGYTGSGEDTDSLEREFQKISFKNSNTVLSRNHNKSFVVRGDNLGVYSNNEEGARLSSIIKGIKDEKNKELRPGRVMLHDRENRLVMSSANNGKKLYELDLERGGLVDEWDMGENSIKYFAPKSKYAQCTPEREILAVSSNSLLTIDPRLPGSKVVDSNSKKYATNNKFSCIATTDKGEVAVGSETGQVRLYNKINVRAKTCLQGSGEKIIGVDTTEDGRYVLATCETHLLLIDTHIEELNTTGFIKPMPRERPPPKRLQLRAEDAIRMNCKVSFIPGRFSAPDGEKRHILTATGPYVVKWNFSNVKKGYLYDYTITKYKENIVEDHFIPDSSKYIFVALPDSVDLIKRRDLVVPNKILK